MLDGFKFQPDLISHFWVTCPGAVQKMISNFSQSPLMRYLSNLLVTRTSIKAENEFEFGPDQIIHFGVIRPWALTFCPIDLCWRKWCIHLFSFNLNSVSIKLTGNEDRHKILDKFELRSDLIKHFGVTCHWVVEKVMFPFNQIVLKLACNYNRHKISEEFKFQLDRTAGFAVKCHWVPKKKKKKKKKKILIGRFCYAKTGFDFNSGSSSFNSSTVSWSFELDLYYTLS